MAVSLQDLGNSHLVVATSGGIFSSGKGAKSPFLSIPSPFELHEWSCALPTLSIPHGGASISMGVPSGSLLASQGFDAQVGTVDLVPTISTHFPSIPVLPLGFFSGISRIDIITKENRSSDSDDNILEEGTPAALPPSHHEKKKSKLTKICERNTRLVFGAGITMAQVGLTENIVLVGGVRGRNYTPAWLQKWTVEVWGNLLAQLPGIITLSRDWFTLIFSQLV